MIIIQEFFFFYVPFYPFLQDEAFALWNQQWGHLYPEESPSRAIINTIQETFYLVNLVDNDYVAGNSLFDVLNSVLTSLKISSEFHTSIQ